MSTIEQRRITLRYDVATATEDWAIPEEPMPESQPHDHTVEMIRALLACWIARTGRDAQVARNLAIRIDPEHWRVGIDPDVCLIEPRTPEGDEIESLCTWIPGHAPPSLAIEVVSSNPQKDYSRAPEKCAAAGIRELVVFDAKLRGPRMYGGPSRIQVWRRSAKEDRAFEKVDSGEGPFHLRTLDAWVFAVDEGRRLRIAEDREGTRWWPTGEEAERAAKESERAAKESERAAKEAERAAKESALARVAELEAELLRRGG